MAFVTQILAIRLIPISTAMVLFYAYPAFAALFSALLFKEKISKELLWVFVALCGVAIFFDFKLEGGLLGQAISLLGAAFAGVAVACIKRLRENNGPVEIYLYFCLTGATIAFFPFASNPQLPASPHDFWIVGGIIGFSLVAQLIMNQGFQYCKSWEGGLFLMSEVVFVALWGILFLQEPVNWHFWVGGPIILGSIVGLNLSKARTLSHGETTLSEGEKLIAKR
jgi:drug/metabolite transporter (DMT)-like permease